MEWTEWVASNVHTNAQWNFSGTSTHTLQTKRIWLPVADWIVSPGQNMWTCPFGWKAKTDSAHLPLHSHRTLPDIYSWTVATQLVVMNFRAHNTYIYTCIYVILHTGCRLYVCDCTCMDIQFHLRAVTCAYHWIVVCSYAGNHLQVVNWRKSALCCMLGVQHTNNKAKKEYKSCEHSQQVEI